MATDQTTVKSQVREFVQELASAKGISTFTDFHEYQSDRSYS